MHLPTLFYLFLWPATIWAASFNNCSGTVQTPPPSSASATLPKVSRPGGWEFWEYEISAAINKTVILFKWQLGDPNQARSDPSKASFSVAAIFTNGTSFHIHVDGKLKTELHENGLKSIALGDNKLQWDDTKKRYNITINQDGFNADLTTEVLPATPNTPSHGRLANGLYSSVPIPRGHVDGPLTWPWGEHWLVQNVASLEHTYGNKPLQKLVSTYSRGSAWTGPFAPATSVNWYTASADPKNCERAARNLTAGQLSLGIPQTLFFQATNDAQNFNYTTSGSAETISLTFPGCSATSNSPFSVKVNPIRVGEFKDTAGGVTVYSVLNVTADIPFNNTVVHSPAGLGFYKVYTA